VFDSGDEEDGSAIYASRKHETAMIALAVHPDATALDVDGRFASGHDRES
jgi:hypothetical protein